MGDVNEHDWRVIFPATNSNDANELVTSESREFALADELLHAYVVATPRAEADPLEIRALDIQISARVMADGEAAASLSSSKTALATTWTSVRTEKDATKNQLKTNYAAALFSYSLVLGAPENEPIIHSQSRAVLFPVRIPLSLTTLRAIPANPRLDISVTIQPRHLQNLHQGIDFDSPNLLDGLSDDPYFNPNALPVHSLPFQLKRQSVANLFQVPLIVNKSIPLLSCFALTLRAFEASSTTVILRASLINLVPVSEACSVKVMSLVPEIPGQTIKSICAGAFPAELLAGDEACFVFNALKLSNGSNHFAEPESDQKQQIQMDLSF
ncbi:hypothetical protein BC830DRAFT_351782 [Chytriomyces sp. MP71]|nr:hypothetical protein BC830DRAFT_351782 [Chytriomyces sp. MP71]